MRAITAATLTAPASQPKRWTAYSRRNALEASLADALLPEDAQPALCGRAGISWSKDERDGAGGNHGAFMLANRLRLWRAPISTDPGSAARGGELGRGFRGQLCARVPPSHRGLPRSALSWDRSKASSAFMSCRCAAKMNAAAKDQAAQRERARQQELQLLKDSLREKPKRTTSRSTIPGSIISRAPSRFARFACWTIMQA